MPNKVIAKIGLQTSTLVAEVECKEDEYKCGSRRLCKTCDTGSVSHSLSHCLVTPESAKNTRVQSVCFDIKKKWAVRHSIVLILKVFFFSFQFCRPKDTLCNMQDDCGDGSDEQGCRKFSHHKLQSVQHINQSKMIRAPKIKFKFHHFFTFKIFALRLPLH